MGIHVAEPHLVAWLGLLYTRCQLRCDRGWCYLHPLSRGVDVPYNLSPADGGMEKRVLGDQLPAALGADHVHAEIAAERGPEDSMYREVFLAYERDDACRHGTVLGFRFFGSADE